MHVILEGSLRHFPVTELLHLFGERAHTGTFIAETPGGRARISFHEGRVVWAEAANAPAPGDVVALLLVWSDGTFSFLDVVAVPEGVTPLALDVAALMADAEARLAERKRLLQLYPDDQIVLRVVNRPAVSGAINLSPEEFQILFQFAGGRSLAQVVSDTKRPAIEVYPLIHRLQTNGLLEPAKPDPDATARTPPDEEPKTLAEPRVVAPPPAPKVSQAVAIDQPTVQARIKPATEKAKPAMESKVAPPEQPKVAPPAQPKATASVQPKVTAPVQAKVEPPAEPAVEEAPPVEKKPRIATLTDDDGTMHPLLEDVTTIGRDASNDIAIDSGSISTRHARVLRSGEGFAIEDLRSRNGTFINSEKVTEKRPLADGDIVRLGKVILTFNLAVEMKSKSSTRELRPT